MVRISYHGSVKVLQDRMFGAPSPFARQEWFALLENSGAQSLFAVAETNDDFVILPLIQRQSMLEPLANWYSFTWQPVMSGKACNAELLTALARDLKRRAHRITLSPIPDEDGSASLVTGAFRDAGWRVSMQQSDHNHVLPIDGRSFAEYWSQRPGRMRTTLKRKCGKVDVTINTRFDGDGWAAYERIYEDSWKPAEGDAAMLSRFAEQEGVAGRLRLGLAVHDGTPVAAQFWTIERGTAYIHKLAHQEAARRLSAGTTLSAAMFKRAIDVDRVSLIDFGTGNDRYKTDWMEEVRPRYRIDCLDPAQPQSWLPLLRRNVTGLRPRLASLRPRR